MQFTQADRSWLDSVLPHDAHVMTYEWANSEQWLFADNDEYPTVDDMRQSPDAYEELRREERRAAIELEVMDEWEFQATDHQAHVAAYDQDEMDRSMEHEMNDHGAHVQTRFDHQYGIDDDIPF
jgi:hypothetical protein